MQGVKAAVANFVRDLMRLKSDIIARNFDAETLTRMTGEDVTPAVMEILRNDFTRFCSIDIETDSTVEADEATEKEANAQIMQVIGGTMTAGQGLLQAGMLPPPMVINLDPRNDQDAAASRAAFARRHRPDRRLSGDAGGLHADGPDGGPDAPAAATAVPEARPAADLPARRRAPAEARTEKARRSYPLRAARRHLRGSCKWPRQRRRKAAKKPAARNVSRKTKARPKRKQRETRKMPIDKGASEETKTDKKSGPGATPGKPDKDPKDKPELGAVGEDPTEKKHTPPPDKQPNTPNTIHNRDQDPDHPANKTRSVEADPIAAPGRRGHSPCRRKSY